MIHLSPYLSLKGNCREVLSFYQSCLGGELNLQRFGDSPASAHMPVESQDAILHGTLTTPGFTIMASDAGGLRTPLIVGDNVALSLHFEDDTEVEAAFARLSEGGTVIDPLADMFWGGKFGALTDRFGIKWLFNFQKNTI